MESLSSWLIVARLGLVQASIGAMVVFATSTLNRIMVVELALPAFVPGMLVAFHYAVQMLRPRLGFGSDREGRRTPWIAGGMVCLATGTVLAAVATGVMQTSAAQGFGLALLAFGLIGLGVGSAGTALLVLLANLVDERSRAAAATLVWMMMIAGFIATAAVAGRLIDPFSFRNVIEAAALIAGVTLLVSLTALRGVEGRATQSRAAIPDAAATVPFRAAFGEVWRESGTRRFTLFVFLSMLAYSGQELIIEPFAGKVFGFAPAESAKLAGLQHTGLLCGMILVAVLGSAIGTARLRSMRFWTSAGCLASAVAILMLAATGFSSATGPMRIALFGLGVANGSFSIAAIGAMMQLAGTGQAGRQGVRMGLWGAAQATAFALGGFIGTLASDLARHLTGSPQIGYGLVFFGEAVLFCWAAGLAVKALPGRSAVSSSIALRARSHAFMPGMPEASQ